MKTLTTLKTLPLIGLLAMGLALTPVVSMADDDDRGQEKQIVDNDAQFQSPSLEEK